MSGRRRLIVLILFLVTLIVGAGAIYVGIQLQQQPNVTPDDTSASPAACCQNSGGSCNGQASGSCGGFDPGAACNSGRGWCWCAQINNPCVPDGGGAPEGTRENFCGTGNYDGQVTLDCPPGYRGAGSTMNIGASATICSGCSSSPPPPAPAPPAPAPAPPPPPPPPPPGGRCDDGCNSNADCDSSGPGGTALVCGSNGMCVNPLCPTDTVPGNNCDCRTPVQACGQPCGNAFPLCAPASGSACRYILGPSCPSSQTSNPTTYCVPLAANLPPGYSTPKCVATDTGNSYLLGPNGKTTFTQAEVQALCNFNPTDTPTPTPTNTPTPSPTTPSLCGGTCDPTPANGVSTCPNNPPHTCVPNNGDQNNGTCRLTACVSDPDSCNAAGCQIIPDCGQPCNPANGANACSNNHVCRDPDSNGSFNCILTACDTNPGSCAPGFCSVAGALTVTKTANQECIASATSDVVTYTVTVTNPDTSARIVDIIDDLDDRIIGTTSTTEPYVYNIIGGGTFASGRITWSAVSIPAGGNVAVTYQVAFPQTLFGTPFNNTVTVMQGSTEAARDDLVMTPACIPPTALISDTADRILIAVSLIIVGMLMYRLKLHEQIGNLFWEQGAGKLTNIGKGVKANKKRDFERAVEETVISKEQKQK